jgi:hypothetical protein
VGACGFVGRFGARTRSWQTGCPKPSSHGPFGRGLGASVPVRFLGRTKGKPPAKCSPFRPAGFRRSPRKAARWRFEAAFFAKRRLAQVEIAASALTKVTSNAISTTIQTLQRFDAWHGTQYCRVNKKIRVRSRKRALTLITYVAARRFLRPTLALDDVSAPKYLAAPLASVSSSRLGTSSPPRPESGRGY